MSTRWDLVFVSLTTALRRSNNGNINERRSWRAATLSMRHLDFCLFELSSSTATSWEFLRWRRSVQRPWSSIARLKLNYIGKSQWESYTLEETAQNKCRYIICGNITSWEIHFFISLVNIRFGRLLGLHQCNNATSFKHYTYISLHNNTCKPWSNTDEGPKSDWNVCL